MRVTIRKLTLPRFGEDTPWEGAPLEHGCRNDARALLPLEAEEDEGHRVRRCWRDNCGVDELGDALEPGVMSGLSGPLVQQLFFHEQHHVRSWQWSTS